MGNVKGRRLEGLVERVLPLHEKAFPTYRKSAKIDYSSIQEELFEKSLEHDKEKHARATRMRTFLGRFYEILISRIYGGDLRDIKHRHKFAYEGGEVVPDIVDDERRRVIEVKGTVQGDTLGMGESQFRGLQHGQYLNPDFQFFYALCRHNVEGIESFVDEQSVFDSVINKTAFIVFAPLSIFIEVAKKNLKGVSSFYRNGETAWADNLLLSSTTVNRLLIEPESLLDQLGINVDDYKIQRFLSPDNFRFNGRRLRSAFAAHTMQFPIVNITHRNYFRWVSEFVQEYIERLKKEAEDEDFLPLPNFKLNKSEEDTLNIGAEEFLEREAIQGKIPFSSPPVPASEKQDDGLPF